MAVKVRGKRYKEAAKLVPGAPVALEAALPVLKQMKKAGGTKFDETVNLVVHLGIDAKQAGAVEAGADELVAKVTGGWTDFDVAVATPDMMPKIARLGKVLGPQGKMPSPKAGTVTPDVATAVREYTAGKIEFRNDAGGNIHAVIGKVSFSDQDLAANAQTLINTLRKMKPVTAKGTYIKKVTIHSSMSPGIPIDTTHMEVVEEEKT